MNWFFAVVRIAGSSFPLAASLSQLQTELDSLETQKRLQKLEDPLSALHPEVRTVSRHIYDALVQAGLDKVELTDELYAKYGRPLAMLESRGFLEGNHSLAGRFTQGLRVSPSYVIYICGLFEDPAKMDRLMTLIDNSPRGSWLHGAEVAKDLDLPIRVVKSVFEIYEANGLGLCSKQLGTANYQCQA